MEIIIPGKNKKAIHPLLIAREAWAICLKNLKKLSAIFLIFNLPVLVIYLTPLGDKLQHQKLSFSTFIFIVLPVLVLSVWGNIALLIGAKKAVGLEEYTVSESIKQARPLFFKYLGTGLSATLFLACLIISGFIFVAVAFPLLLKINKILAISICLAAAIAVIGVFIYFMLRWSLATAVCVFENSRPFAALKRSFSLVTEYVHPVVGTYCLFTLMYIACMFVFVIIGALLGLNNNQNQSNWAGMIFSMLINIVLVPFWTTATVILYKNLKEALETHVYA
jgi:hypothetical protein